MKYGVYSIRDELVGFGMPFLSENHLTAQRLALNGYRQPGSIYQVQPGDYTLYNLGEYDTDTGEFNTHIPDYVIGFIEFKKEGK